ncbi:phosphoribosylamine--glycine ligase [Herbiconiux sp. 11R-BC]|uniref:phosphoribosylamine--glycine ligase n=1 Tax=Herbiconiux sp. 11R-BC TaxID=3111637 RepID=UPI003C026D48
MKILVLGSGAREHAIITALLRDDAGHEIIAAPGNAGIAADVPTVQLDAESPHEVAEYAIAEDVQFVIVGPEAPLVAGVADALRTRGIPVFGPGKEAAALEGSKAFAKRIMDAAGVPTGRARNAGTLAEAEAVLAEFGAPYVVKADGLAAGKGVLVTTDLDAATAHARHWLEHGEVLIEEFLDGQEISLFLVSDGHDVAPLSPAQDYKRLLDGDEGPNTGGMGAYSPLPWLDEQFGSEKAFVDEVIDTVALPTVRQLAAEGTPFIGLLYCGLILTPKGLRVIEFNARFGDPETQVVLPRLESPLGALLFAAATGTLGDHARPSFRDEVAVTVVLASENYPGSPVTGRIITGLENAVGAEGVSVMHAATDRDGDDIRATGGRVLSVVATAPDFATARDRVYGVLEGIHLEGAQYRSDIAARVVPGGGQASTPVPGWRHLYSGKVRELYVPAEAADGAPDAATPDARPAALLVVASDRVSAFDHVLEPGIPGKGELLTTLSRWWFHQLAEVPNHLVEEGEEGDAGDVGASVPPVPAAIAGRSMVVKSLEMFPIECVVRGYLSGSGWKEYQVSQSVCGVPLPAGLADGDRLPEPIYTPAYKAPMGEHDENISFEKTVELVGPEVAEALRELSLAVYRRAAAIAEARGVILADTKFEFGRDPETGEITLADEVLTSDSSRYWDAAGYDSGDRTASFDKQIVRNWLAANWDGEGVPPTLPPEIVEQTVLRYRELLERLTGTRA